MKAQLFDITHTTTYDYRSPVTVAHHLLRLAPRRLRRQLRLAHELYFKPAPASLQPSPDYFGNEVAFAIFEGAHRQLRVTARSRVAVGRRLHPGRRRNPRVGERSQPMPDGSLGAGPRGRRIYLRLPAGAARRAVRRLRPGILPRPDAPSSTRCST